MGSMRKYVIIAQGMMQETFVYRVNFMMWRLRCFLSLITIYFLWTALIPQQAALFGYSHTLILTYIIVAYFINAFVFSSRSERIASDITSGDLSNRLLKPVNYFGTLFATDIGDKLMNIFFSIFELFLFLFFFHPPLQFQTNSLTFVLFVLSVVIAIGLFFYCNILIGSIGFWSPDVWAPRFIFLVLIQAFTGMVFLLDVLPKFLFTLFQLTPFPYFIFYPVKIYLGQVSFMHALLLMIPAFLWLVILRILATKVWRYGVRQYTAHGR